MYVVSAWCLGRPEKDIRSLVLGLQEVDVFQVGAGNQTRVLEELLTAQSSFQPLDRGC